MFFGPPLSFFVVLLNRQPLFFRIRFQRNSDVVFLPEYLAGQKLPDTTDEVIHMLCKEESKSGKCRSIATVEQCNCVQ